MDIRTYRRGTLQIPVHNGSPLSWHGSYRRGGIFLLKEVCAYWVTFGRNLSCWEPDVPNPFPLYSCFLLGLLPHKFSFDTGIHEDVTSCHRPSLVVVLYRRGDFVGYIDSLCTQDSPRVCSFVEVTYSGRGQGTCRAPQILLPVISVGCVTLCMYVSLLGVDILL